jgi:NADH oxidase (H2O2-forming)
LRKLYKVGRDGDFMKVVIIGLGTAGYAAAMEAAKRGADITIIEKRDFETFSPCGLPYVIDGSIPHFEDLKHTIKLRNTEKLLSHQVKSIAVDEKKVIAKNVKTGKEKDIGYDKLIIATGNVPVMPPVPGVHTLLGKGTFMVSTIKDTYQLKEKAESSQSCVVVGTGAIGLETACALQNKGLTVTMVEMLPSIFPQAIDADMGSEVKNHLESLGISVNLNAKVESIQPEQGHLVVKADKKYVCDFAVIAAGVRADYALAEKAGIRIGKWGIAVTPRMETSEKDVYACGDCIQTFSSINGEPWMMQMATSALQMGYIAAVNATGGYKEYQGCLNTFASELAGKEIAGCGFTESQAKGFGYETAIGKGTGTVTADYYPGEKMVKVKLVVNKKDHTLLGGQAFGVGAFWRVNVISMGLKARMTVEEFSTMELAYTPPLSPSYDALQKACDFVLRRL